MTSGSHGFLPRASRGRGGDSRQTLTEIQIKLMSERFAEHSQFLKMVMNESLFGT